MESKFRGSLLGLAYADALGAGYEFFKGTIGEDEEIDFLELPKITAHKKYEWTDDTAMTFLTLKAMQRKKDRDEFSLNTMEIDYELLSELFIQLYKGAPDKGMHTYNVLSQTEAYKKEHPEEKGVMQKIAKELTVENPMTAGNGGLMRIAAGIILLKGSPWNDDHYIMEKASELNNLTHPHPDSEACCQLFLFLLNAIIKEDPFIERFRPRGVTILSNRDIFKQFIANMYNELAVFGSVGTVVFDAFKGDLNLLNPNRYVVTTYALALGAIYQAWDDGISPKEHYINTIHKCIRVGDDTDTTSAVAGAMVGAIYGEECLPDDIDKIHGYAGEKFEHVTYEDMVNTINALL